MEYDNDRIVPGTHKAEVICWAAVAMLPVLLNGLGSFPNDGSVWLTLALCSLSSLPLYVLFSRLAVPRFLFRRKPLTFISCAVLLMVMCFGIIFLLYDWTDGWVPDSRKNYFVFSGWSAAREIAWIGLNGFFAICIAQLRRRLDEKHSLATVGKELDYYKIRYYRTQLNPHFLFNTLNSIYSLSLQQKERTPEVVVRLADIMRFLIYECNEDKIPLDKEIEFIRNYIEIEKIRYDADIRFSIEGDTSGVMIEPFLFISFIENGFKHAIDTSFAKPFIYITLTVGTGEIRLTVINNTSLEIESQAKKILGKGLTNSKAVLELLYPDAHALDIIQVEILGRKESTLRLKNAQERLEQLYPDAHTLDVILNNNSFTVSLVLKKVIA